MTVKKMILLSLAALFLWYLLFVTIVDIAQGATLNVVRVSDLWVWAY